MLRRDLLKSAVLMPALAQAQGRRKPNVVLLFADDLGYAGIGVQGCTDIPTPNIDSIARNGVRFTNGYVSCPVCSPTRAGLMTGRYQQRFGHEFNPGPATEASDNFGLPLEEKTIADYLRALNYRTAIIGKWHLGYRREYLPLKRGFDLFFGFPGGAHSYLDSRDRPGNPIMRGVEEVEEKEYLTDAFAREATSFIDQAKRQPFFLYLAFNAVHNPLQATEKYLARFAAISDPRRRTYAAMMSAMDDAIGRVLAKLREHQLEQDTLIFFLSDNGGPTPQTTSSNHPLRGYKGQVWEGGIRVPFLMQWKGRIPAGRVYDQPVIALDVLPTALAAAEGALPPNLDGANLLPFVTGQAKGAPHETLYWRFGAAWAVRRGDWKLLEQGDGMQLFNLAQDVGEQKNLAAEHPEKVRELRAAWEAWNRQLAPPKWRTQRMGRKKRKQ